MKSKDLCIGIQEVGWRQLYLCEREVYEFYSKGNQNSLTVFAKNEKQEGKIEKQQLLKWIKMGGQVGNAMR